MEPFLQLSTPAKLMLTLVVSVFLPVYVTVPVVLAAAGYIVYSYRHFPVAYGMANLLPLLFECFAVLVVPLFYRNYYGFLCAILFAVYLMMAVYFNRTAAPQLFDTVCDLCCALSVPCLGIAMFQRFVLHQGRMLALTYNSNFYAYLIELIVVICCYKAITSERMWTYLLLAAANVITLFLTGCRSAWAGIVVGLFALLLLLRKRVYAQMLSAVSAFGAFAVAIDHSLIPRYDDFDPTLSNRFYIWQTALEDFSHHPLFGRGFLAMFQVTGNPITPHAHSLYIDTLECTGIVGALILSAYAILVFRQLFAAWRSRDETQSRRAVLVISLLAATFMHGFTDIPVMGVQTGLLLILTVALRPQVTLEYSVFQKSKLLYRMYLMRFRHAAKKENVT